MSKFIGDVSAYAYAVSKGYTGTEEEFAELMASYADVGQTAVDAKDAAVAAKTAAQTAATTATTKASEATTAATTATTKAGEASTSASTATSAKDTAVSASQTATTKASEATTAAATATSAKTDAVAANTAAQSAKTAAQTAQAGAETAAASVQSSAAQIQTNADDISELKEDLGEQSVSWTSGKYIKGDGTEESYSIYSYSDEIMLYGTSIHLVTRVNATAYYVIAFYDAWHQFISGVLMPDVSQSFTYDGDVTIPESAVYARVNCLSNGIDQYFSYELKQFIPSSLDKISKLMKARNPIQNYNEFLKWEIGSIYGAGGTNYNASTAIRTKDSDKVLVDNDNSTFSSLDPDATAVYAFQYNKDTETYVGRLGQDGKKYVSLTSGYLYRFVVKYQKTITSETIDGSAQYVVGGVNDFESYSLSIMDLQNKTSKDLGASYAVASDFSKRKMTVSKLSQLSQWQSFCKYDGKYFSAGGNGKIGVQDKNFNLISTESIWVGHGNAFCLGHNGKGYVSGWDDQKIYVIDLDNVALDDTITLPTTGNTICAVDDINNIAYILQTDTSNVTSQISYNFIAYDYSNDEILSQKKLPFMMSTMQDCDFVDGKIILSGGLGTSASPNQYMILNTNGDVIGEYVIGDSSSLEQEGICIDRDTYDLYISKIDGYVYKVLMS